MVRHQYEAAEAAVQRARLKRVMLARFHLLKLQDCSACMIGLWPIYSEKQFTFCNANSLMEVGLAWWARWPIYGENNSPIEVTGWYAA